MEKDDDPFDAVLQSPELLKLIFEDLGLLGTAAVSSVCKAWSKALAAIPEDHPLWRRECIKAFGALSLDRRAYTVATSHNRPMSCRSWKSLLLQHYEAVRIAQDRAVDHAFRRVMRELVFTLAKQPAAPSNFALGISICHKNGAIALHEEISELPLVAYQHREFLRMVNSPKDAAHWSLTSDGKLRLGLGASDELQLGELADLYLSIFILRKSDDKVISLCHNLAPEPLELDLSMDSYFHTMLEWEVNFTLSSMDLQISAFISRPDVLPDQCDGTCNVDLSVYMPKLMYTDAWNDVRARYLVGTNFPARPSLPPDAWGTISRDWLFGLLRSSDLWV